MSTAAPPVLLRVPPPSAGMSPGFARWVRSHRGSAAVAGLLAFAGPLTFFTGALGVVQTTLPTELVRLGLWWSLYGATLWSGLLVAGYVCERLARGRRAAGRNAIWLVGGGVAAALPNLATAGRADLLIEHGLVHSAWTMHLHGFIFSLIMALLYFAHLRRSGEHEQAAARLAAAQAAQRHARRRLAQARLQEVQARIDPLMLFDMLAKVRGLYEREPLRAEQFLDDLIVFLRAALPRLRTPSSSLPSEAELARAFVRLHALARAFGIELEVDMAPDVMHARFPPGVLLPLLNAGLAAGATLCRLSAIRVTDHCMLVLALDAVPSECAVDRVRDLLEELYGPAGSLQCEAAAPGAVRLLIRVPHEFA